MNALKNNPRDAALAEEALKEQLRRAMLHDDWMSYKDTVNKLAGEFHLDLLDCAAALAFLLINPAQDIIPAQKNFVPPELKMLRYRLEVGRKHQLSEDDIKTLLIEEAGVERRLIGRVDIHHDHTLVQLPHGMPAEIYHHLKTVEFNGQPLCIKRVDNGSRPNPKAGKKPRRRRRPHAAVHKDGAVRQEPRDINRTQKD